MGPPDAGLVYYSSGGGWTLTLTLRRVLDAGMSAWATLFYFVPYLNYCFMLALCFLPTAPAAEPAAAEWRAGDRTLPEALLSMGAG